MKAHRLGHGHPCTEHGLKASARLQVNIAPGISLMLCPECIRTLKGILIGEEARAFQATRLEAR